MSKLKGQVLAGKLLIKQYNAEEKTEGGIIIPDTAKKKPRKGEVILAGADTPNVHVESSPGDTVYFSENTGTPLNLHDEEYLLIDQTQVLLFGKDLDY